MLNGIVLHIKLVSINKADKILRFEKLHLHWKMLHLRTGPVASYKIGFCTSH